MNVFPFSNMLLHLTFLSTILFLLLRSQATPLQNGVQSLDQPNRHWPKTPFQYRGRAWPPYVLYFDVLGDEVESAHQYEARRAVEWFTRTFKSLKLVTKKFTIRSNNIALTFDPFAASVSANDVQHCAGQFEEAQAQYGARVAFGYCHKANIVFGTIGLAQRAKDSTEWPSPWPNPPFLDRSLSHGQKLLFVNGGPFISPHQSQQFIVLLHKAEIHTQTAARVASGTMDSNHHVSVMSVNFQFDFTWTGHRSGDDILYAFYAFVGAQYLYEKRCVDAFWQDQDNRHIGKFSITKHGSPTRLGVEGANMTNGTEAPTFIAKKDLESSSFFKALQRT